MNQTEYIVPETTKKLWDIELDIYKLFRKICDKHNLRHYAIAGTLLGAVRHKGFIPWDDDMDFAMPFEDYIRFMEIAPREFHSPYYFQSYLTDPELGEMSNSRIRRSDTTACTKWEYDNIVSNYHDNIDYNLGIFIDILPLCYVPDDEETIQIQKEEIMKIWRVIRGYNAQTAIKKGAKHVNPDYISYIKDYELFGKNYSICELKALYTEKCGINKGPTKLMGLTTFRTFLPRLMWDTKDFLDVVELPFEDTTVLAPKGYENILGKQYGDWHIPDMNAAFHELFLFDTDTPFKVKFGEQL